MSSKPTIVIVPGAWHSPYHYKPWISHLESEGYPVHCATLITVGAKDVSLNNNDDAAAIRKVIDSINGDVIVAMHSYGGVPASTAAHGAKNVIGLIFVTAFALPSGTTLVADAPQHEVTWRVLDLEKGVAYNKSPLTSFYHDVPVEIAEDLAAHLAPQTLASFATPSNPTAWPELPRIYAVTTEDRTLDASAQEIMVKAAGPWVEVKRIPTGHSPWVSGGGRDKEFLEWFSSAVQKLVGVHESGENKGMPSGRA